MRGSKNDFALLHRSDVLIISIPFCVSLSLSRYVVWLLLFLDLSISSLAMLQCDDIFFSLSLLAADAAAPHPTYFLSFFSVNGNAVGMVEVYLSERKTLIVEDRASFLWRMTIPTCNSKQATAAASE
jgi:hypothetical protein